MILKAWGTWDLFQTLLRLLRDIGDRHGGVSIANVAMRWVLEHAFVGAVLIGTAHLSRTLLFLDECAPNNRRTTWPQRQHG